MRRLSLVAVLLTLSASAKADGYARALAAGYKAQFVCSGVFGAKRTPEAIEAEELTGIYPALQDTVNALAANIDRTQMSVSVAFDPVTLPRIAVWRPGLGCSGLPIGADARAAAALPRLGVAPPQSPRTRAWPDGDAGAEAPDPRLHGIIEQAFDEAHTTGIVIVAGGRIAAERYAPGFGAHVPQRTWSVAKSIAGTLVGIATRQGIIDPAQPAPIAEWQRPHDPRRTITTEQLLRMTSGLHSNGPGNRTDAVYFGGTAVGEKIPGEPLETLPGRRFRYANNDTLLAVYGLRTAIGDDTQYLAFPFTELFWKIGMTSTFAETDWQGNFILSSQVWTTARDLARFGMLYLGDGVWNGERLLPEGWVRHVSVPDGPQPDGAFGYGATFWLMNRSAGIPADTFAAFGNRGQFVVIVPSRNIVIVRRGEDHAGIRFDIAGFTAKVLAALD